MAENDQSQEKTEEPTQRRLENAHERPLPYRQQQFFRAAHIFQTVQLRLLALAFSEVISTKSLLIDGVTQIFMTWNWFDDDSSLR